MEPTLFANELYTFLKVLAKFHLNVTYGIYVYIYVYIIFYGSKRKLYNRINFQEQG